MPTIRLLLLITGNLRTCSCSMCRTALARSSSSRQQWMPGVITSRAVARPASKLSCAKPLQTISRSVTMPISRSFSPIGMAPISCSHINFASSVTGVSGPTQSTPLCIASLTFMADLRRGGLFGYRIGLHPYSTISADRVLSHRSRGLENLVQGSAFPNGWTKGRRSGSDARTHAQKVTNHAFTHARMDASPMDKLPMTAKGHSALEDELTHRIQIE